MPSAPIQVCTWPRVVTRAARQLCAHRFYTLACCQTAVVPKGPTCMQASSRCRPRCCWFDFALLVAEGHRPRTSFVTLSDVQPRTPLSRADSPFTAQLKALPGLQASALVVLGQAVVLQASNTLC